MRDACDFQKGLQITQEFGLPIDSVQIKRDPPVHVECVGARFYSANKSSGREIKTIAIRLRSFGMQRRETPRPKLMLAVISVDNVSNRSQMLGQLIPYLRDPGVKVTTNSGRKRGNHGFCLLFPDSEDVAVVRMQ